MATVWPMNNAFAERPSVPIPGGEFTPLFGTEPGKLTVTVVPFRLDVNPVTNAEFFAFVLAHTEWQREVSDARFVDRQYLSHWQEGPRGNAKPTAEQADRPVTYVSWHAADAFCHAQGGLLPTTFQWELAAAADTNMPDARNDPAFIAQVLAWYAQPFKIDALRPADEGPPNFYGVRGLHRQVWEWVDDFDSPRFTGAGGRGEGDPSDRTCGTGAYGAQGVQDYAAFMRFALRGSLQASYTMASVGFRCAYAAQ